MKKYIPLALMVLMVACSRFEEDYEMPVDLPSLDEVETELPVINITVDQDEFDEMYEKVEEEIELEASFDMYRNNELVISGEEVEIEIKGGFSTRFSLKTLGIKFEDKFDNSDRSLINPERILPHHNIDKIKAIRLRNSGSDFKNTMLKDLSITQLAINAGLDLDLTYGEPSLVYINEVFYGLLNIRTEGNTNGMAGLYGVKKKAITLAKITTHELIKKDGDFDRIDAFVEAINRKDIAYLKEELDLVNFIDYMVFQSYIGNTDWPHNNSRFYAIEDGKFRFVLFDLDKVTWLKISKDPLTIIENKGRKNVLTDLFFALYEDQTFQQDFWNRYHELLASGLIAVEQLQAIIQANAARINSEIPLQIQKHNAPRTMIEWNIEMDKTLTLFGERELIVKAAIK